MAFRHTSWSAIAALLAVLAVGCSGGRSGGSVGIDQGSSPENGIFAGVILDDRGDPVEGAIVSVDGVEAVTAADGSFRIEEPLLAPEPSADGTAASNAPPKISVLKPGYEPVNLETPVGPGERILVELVRSGLDLEVTVTDPFLDEVVMLPDTCDPVIRLEGFAGPRSREGFRLDVCVVLDLSGSTARDAFDVDQSGDVESVLEAEVHAARRFLQTLDRTSTRVALVTFSDEASVLAAFGPVQDALDALEAPLTPDGGTNFEAALRESLAQFEARAALDDDEALASPHEAGASETPRPERAVVFLTDGVPTIYGYPERVPFDSNDRDRTTNLTWHPVDSRAALEAAKDLSRVGKARLFAYSIIGPDDPNRKRKTLPACVAQCKGRYRSLETIEELADELLQEPLVEVRSISVRARTGPAHPATLLPGGRWVCDVPIRAQDGEPLLDGSARHELDVVGVAVSGDSTIEVSVQHSVRTVSRGAVEAGVFDAQAAQAGVQVSQVAALSGPDGGALGDEDLLDFLQSEYEDAVELLGADTYQTAPGSGTVTLTVDFAYKEACFRSDFGYVVVDPQSPPASAAEALAAIDPSNRLFNSSLGTSGCRLESIADGTARFEVVVPSGSVVAFFILPDRTLEQYIANPDGGRAPLFTIPGLNPGGFDQVLSFVSVAGRTAAGSEDTTVLTAGPLVVFAFEDQAIDKGSDMDFSDVVFTVRGVTSRLDEARCDD